MKAPTNALYVISYPRSGNTWTINSLKILYNGIRCEAYSDFKYYKHTWKNDQFQMKCEEKIVDDRIAIIKSHCHSSTFANNYPTKKVIYVQRDGRDTLLSYYFYCKAFASSDITVGYYSDKNIMYGGADEQADINFIDEEFQDFIHKNALAWKDHVQGWLEHADKFVVRYEDLSMDHAAALDRISRYLGFKQSADIKEIDFFWKNKFRSDIFRNSNKDFFRKGMVGDWKNFFTVKHLETFNRLTGNLNRFLGYDAE